MLRIWLGLDDLARIRLATGGVAATIEAVYSGIALRRADSALWYGDWGRRLRPRLRPEMAPLLELFRSEDQVPRFMVMRTSEPEAFAEHLLALPTAQIRDELPVTGPYARRLAGGDRAARAQLAAAITSYHREFADALPTIRQLVQADVARRGAVLAGAGLSALMSSLHPGIRWRSPILEIDNGADREMELDGRGLRFTPAVFLRERPWVLIEPETVFVTYPVPGSLRLGSTAGDPLVELLGRTRAAALRALHTSGTTTELAQRLDVSLASASEHAAVLRRAGLVATHREGRSVRHGLTALGYGTLAGGSTP